MLIVNPVSPSAGRYYFDGPPVGRWCGAGRLDLGLDGEVTAPAMAAVLQGRHPSDGRLLLDRRHPHRRAGWDLILTAPKSVSLVAGLAPDGTGALLHAAHRRACADAFGWLEEHACWARRRATLVATSGFIAARFAHRTSSAGEPHLHTHVLVANAVRAADGRWSALDGSGLWLNRRAVAAVYHLALRQQLLAAGLRFRWVVHPDGSADVADVPREAIEATSTRRSQIRDRLAGEDDPAPFTRTAAQRLSRSGSAPSGPWVERAAHAGFGPDDAVRVLAEAGRRAELSARADPGDGRRLVGDVTAWLAERRSTFGMVDVFQALAATHAEGATAADTHRWARDFHDASPPAADGRRTSPLASTLDDALVLRARAISGGGDPGGIRPGALTVAAAPRPTVPDVVRRLTRGDGGVEVLAPPRPVGVPGDWRITREKGGFLAQADVLDHARLAWQRTGRTVAVATPSLTAARRWRALAGLDRHVPGTSLPAVLIVDRADRRPTADLGTLLDEAAGHGTRVVLVIGGTLPARRAPISQAVGRLADQLGRVVPLYRSGPEPPPDPVAGGGMRVCTLGRQALGQVVSAWSQTGRPGRRPQMVALGPAECDELNRRARAVLREAGAITGAEVDIFGRPFAVGDEVVGIRQGALPAGVRAVVIGTGVGQMLVATSGKTVPVDTWNGRHLRHAYAVTPGMLRFDAGPVIVLGDPADLGRHHDRVVAAGLVAAGSRRTTGVAPSWSLPTRPGRGRERQPGLGL